MPFFGVPIRNGLPIGLGSVAGFGVQQFDPSQLFEGGTVAGAWYDPSDLSTMFTTDAGTTPVTMPGQGSAVSVGLMLDKSQNGVGTNGAKRVNLLTYSEDFSNAAWTKQNSTAANTTATLDPLGGTTAEKFSSNTATSVAHACQQTVLVNATTVFSVYAKAGELSRIALGRTSDNVGKVFDLVAGTAHDLGSSSWSGWTSATAGNFSIQSAGNGWWRISITSSASALNGRNDIYLIDNNGNERTFATASGNGVYIWGADLRLASEANTLPLYQPITSSWYATLPGNHAISFNNTTARPELRARVNLLTYSEEFDNGAWTKTLTSSAAGTTAVNDPIGGLTADLYSQTAGTPFISQNVTLSSATSLTASCYFRKNVGDFVNFFCADTATISNGFRCFLDLSTGQKGTEGAVGSGATFTGASVQDAGNGWYRLSITGQVGAATTAITFGFYVTATDNTGTRLTPGSVYVWGADLRPANIGANVPAYQRIADALTYDISGFPLYLRFDGIDDSMYTPANLNLSSTDKVGVFAGVRKLSDAASAVLTEFSADRNANNGAFTFAAPAGGALRQGYAFFSKGTITAFAEVDTGYQPPITNIITGIGNISGDSVILRINGTQAASSAVDQGTGNYGTYPLYIGSRGSTTAYFNGHLHGLIVVGSAVSAGNISATEQWVAGKTGISIFDAGPSFGLDFTAQSYQVWEF